MEDRFLHTQDAAKFLGLAPITLAKWRRAGEGPECCRCGARAIRYRLSDLIAWAEGRKGRAANV